MQNLKDSFSYNNRYVTFKDTDQDGKFDTMVISQLTHGRDGSVARKERTYKGGAGYNFEDLKPAELHTIAKTIVDNGSTEKARYIAFKTVSVG